MTYTVKEIFYTLRGEGAPAGRPAVFCRFTGCNLWSGREEDRAGAICRFCDTDFVGTGGAGGGRFQDAPALADTVAAERPGGGRPFVVCTGGEPLLQLDETLVEAFHKRGFEVAVETNGTVAPAPAGLDWICVSPKAGASLRLVAGNELKAVVPQPGLDIEALEGPDVRSLLSPADGQRRGRAEYENRGGNLPPPAAMATQSPNAQISGHTVTGLSSVLAKPRSGFPLSV